MESTDNKGNVAGVFQGCECGLLHDAWSHLPGRRALYEDEVVLIPQRLSAEAKNRQPSHQCSFKDVLVARLH
jgi:hypothetical protein